MKAMAILVAASFVLVGCEKQEGSMSESPDAQQSAKTQNNIKEATPVMSAPLNAQSQAVSEADKQITQLIRQSLASQTTPTDLSEAVKNITIVTKDGMVTLKGTIKTEAEKTDLETRTKAIAGVKSVMNELEVKGE